MTGDTVLVVGAHPDDEVLGAGGTIRAHTANGDEVHVLIVTEGATAQYDDESLVAQKREEAQECANRLGVANIHFGDLPDMRLDDCAHVEVNAVIEDAVSRIAPDIVYTHSPTDVNRDHKEVYDSTMVATRPGSGVDRVLAYEVPSSTDWGGEDTPFNPTVYIDVTDHLETKIEAFRAYDSEQRAPPHPRSADVLRALATVRGAAAGYRAAEAFVLAREYRSDP